MPRAKKTTEPVSNETLPETASASAQPKVVKQTKTRKKSGLAAAGATLSAQSNATDSAAAAAVETVLHASTHSPAKEHAHETTLQAEVNIGLTGHVDHGKTSLTKALSGKWTDTHSEELKRGISIRLGYADTTFYEYAGTNGPEKFGVHAEKDGHKGKVLRKVSFIDAPGHETLMTTMLSGASLMHGALLVIAANETCPQPRTAEHLMALQIGGIKNVIVVQNKVDLVDKKRAMESYHEIKKFLKEYGYENAAIVPISANFNANIDVLINAIQTHIPTPHFDAGKPLKMYISRSFDVNKPGTPIEKLQGGVLGGSIVQGTLKPKQKVEITPGVNGKPIVIDALSLNISSGHLNEARPGGLIAMGTMLDPGITSMDKFKGQIVCAPGTLPTPTDFLNIDFNELPRLLGEKLPFPHTNELMVLTIGTNTMVGEIVSVKKNQIGMQLKGKMTIEKGQKIAISRRDKAGWRLAGWGVAR
jgi:translation initiation factor 2 subunit 3